MMIALSFEGVQSLSVINQVAQKGICAWSGNYVTVNVMERLGLGDTGPVLLGVVQYIDENDVNRVVEGLRELAVG